MGELPQLSLAEWIVLALIVESPKHGFAVATLTSATGDIGRVWHVPRPIVYRTVSRLTDLELVHVQATERGGSGPRRSILAATPAGTTAIASWLRAPVPHVREVRSGFLVKLALLARAEQDPRPLLSAQRSVLKPLEAALRSQQESQLQSDFGRVLLTWRIENVRAAIRFLDEVRADQDPAVQIVEVSSPLTE